MKQINANIRLIQLIIGCLFLFVCGVAGAQEVIRGDQLETITSYGKGELASIRTVIKSWQESFDASNRFQISFFGYYPEPAIARNFMQEIKVFDGSKPVNVYDWDSADCCLEKMTLIRDKLKIVYLITAGRTFGFFTDKGDIFPQNEPSPQTIRIYMLVGNSGDLGFPRNYFKKIAEAKGIGTACKSSDVYSIMRKFFNENINN